MFNPFEQQLFLLFFLIVIQAFLMIPNPLNPLPCTHTQLLAPLMLSTTHWNSAEYIELIIQAELFVAKNIFHIAINYSRRRGMVYSAKQTSCV